jgi:hypothetical protein
MDFLTNHNYELFNFDGPVPAHKALRSLGLEYGIMYGKFHRFQILWQKQARREGPDELIHFWVEPASRSSFTLPWPTMKDFEARHLELYPEEILLDFEDTAHPLRYPRFVADRTGQHSSRPLPVFSSEENEFLDAYYDEIRTLSVGPCLAAVDGLEINHHDINHLVGYRATELLHEGRAWPQPHSPAPPIPWPTLDAFKRRFYPASPAFPWHDYVPLDRADFSAREHVFLAHYLHEITRLTSGPAHEYLRSQSLSPTLMIPFLKHSFSYVRSDSSGQLLNPACKLLTEPLPAFEVPWGNRAIFLGRVLRFCGDESMKTLVGPFLPTEESAYVYKPTPYRFYLSQEEEGFIRWYLAETDGATGGLMPATQWLWANGVYPSTLKAFVHTFKRPSDHFYDSEYDRPLPPYMAAWLAKEDFEMRLKSALETFPELKDNPAALPGYLPDGYEEMRTTWLKSIPITPTLVSIQRRYDLQDTTPDRADESKGSAPRQG